jgi:hypothetical protein
MANYVPWYGKKRERLIEHERVFLSLLATDADAATTHEAAEVVRAAQVRALKSRLAQLPPSEKNAAAVGNLDREINFWLGMSPEEIVNGYRHGTLRNHRATRPR